MSKLDSLVDMYLRESPDSQYYLHDFITSLESYKALLMLPADEQAELAIVLCSRLSPGKPIAGLTSASSEPTQDGDARLRALLSALLRRKQHFSEEQLLALIKGLEYLPLRWQDNPHSHLGAAIRRFVDSEGVLSDALLNSCRNLIRSWLERGTDTAKLARRLTEITGEKDAVPPVPLVRNGEIFAEAILDDMQDMKAPCRDLWARLLSHASDSETGSPTAKWVAQTKRWIEAIGEAEVAKRLCKWLSLISRPAEENTDRTITYSNGYTFTHDPRAFIEVHLAILKGMAWIAGIISCDELSRVVGKAGISAYAKIPGTGPRATRVGNACVWALGNIGSDCALAQLALMKVKVKFGTAQNSIEKALVKLAGKLGVSPDELGEMSVPDYGLTEVGRHEEKLGDYTAVLEVDGRKPSITFKNHEGKAMKSVPVAVKRDFEQDLKELRGNAKDLEKMLSAQRERLDNIFLAQKTWPLALWRERYLDHPVVGMLARRLIWWFMVEGKETAAIWLDGNLLMPDGTPLELYGDTTVRIWHPIECSTEEVLAWRRFLFEHMVQQPFKQAHREIYLLTDAERTTRIYSNRFASHVIKQHQFSSLCAARGWKNRLRLFVDDDYPPAFRELPLWDMRAEFWIDGIGDAFTDEFVLESGAFRYLSTDQVRFYPINADQVSAHAYGGGYTGSGADPIPMEDIPLIVLSEILRDVDLFVGVTSVGNDPTWGDGGPGGRFRDYWKTLSFGELGETAETRREIIAGLLPRLKIGRVSRLDGRFLRVSGKLRTYKIHLGSGNILMEPNDQYLCIVKAPNWSTKNDKLFLPFEGDDKLSVIISKAFLLAADDEITDPTINSQIRHS